MLSLRALGVGGGYQSDINDAIRWAAGVKVTGTTANKNPSKVINLSLGGSGGCGKADQEAIDVYRKWIANGWMDGLWCASN